MSENKYLNMSREELLEEVKEYQGMMSEITDLYIELQESFLELKGGRVEDTEDIEKRLEVDIYKMSFINFARERKETILINENERSIPPL